MTCSSYPSTPNSVSNQVSLVHLLPLPTPLSTTTTPASPTAPATTLSTVPKPLRPTPTPAPMPIRNHLTQLDRTCTFTVTHTISISMVLPCLMLRTSSLLSAPSRTHGPSTQDSAGPSQPCDSRPRPSLSKPPVHQEPSPSPLVLLPPLITLPHGM